MNQNQQPNQMPWGNPNGGGNQAPWDNQYSGNGQAPWNNQNAGSNQTPWNNQNNGNGQAPWETPGYDSSWSGQNNNGGNYNGGNYNGGNYNGGGNNGGNNNGSNNNKTPLMIGIISGLVILIAAAIVLIVLASGKKSKNTGTKELSKAETKTTEASTEEITDEVTEKVTEAVTESQTEKITEASTEAVTEKTSTEKASTEKASTEAPETGGEDTFYSEKEISEAVVDYCRYVYCFDDVSASVSKSKKGTYAVKVSVTIDGHTGDIGTMTIDKATGLGTGCKGERVDVFDIRSANIDIHYIIPYSNTRMLSDSDLVGLSRGDLTLARNEIYARHGRKFNDDDIRAYFESQAWYAGIVAPDQFSDSVLSNVEKANISTIKDYEDYLDGDYDDYDDYDDYTVYNRSDYIIPDSSSRYLTYDDIAGLDDHALMLARNEIYARNGRKFNDEEIRNYFLSKAWYNPVINPEDFTESMLSDVEKANIAFIKQYED